MHDVMVAADGESFTRNGRHFFYLADTNWMAFPNAEPDAWDAYLDVRRSQGFNALQISILPVVHDCSELARHPFAFGSGGYDFSRPEDGYFQRARRMTLRAVEKGFVPVLVVLWCTYVPDTWANRRAPEFTLPLERLEGYLDLVLRSFDGLRPIYLACGDALFDSDYELIYYRRILETLRARAVGSLTALHLNPDGRIPSELLESTLLDFHMIQSGHHEAMQDRAFRLAEEFAALPVKRPIVNGEPCYEGHGYGSGRLGRFTAADVRRAAWSSLLAGARAGVAYGAHGIWSWYEHGRPFPGEGKKNTLFSWLNALSLKGAADMGCLRWLHETYRLHELSPANRLLRDDRGGTIRLAASADLGRLALYLPCSTPVAISADLAGHDVVAHVLTDNSIAVPETVTSACESLIKAVDTTSDILIVATAPRPGRDEQA